MRARFVTEKFKEKSDPIKDMGIGHKFIYTIDDFKSFIEKYSDEILSNVHGESDGWNQKMTIINKLIDNNKLIISDDVWEDEEFEDIINGI